MSRYSFVSAATAFREFWSDDQLKYQVQGNEIAVRNRLTSLADGYELKEKVRGLMQCLEVGHTALSQSIRNDCYQAGLIVEACGQTNIIVKLMPPPTIEDQTLANGLEILEQTVGFAFDTKGTPEIFINDLISKDKTI